TPAEAQALRLAVATVHLGEDWAGDALRKIDAGDGSTDGDVSTSTDHPVLAALPALAVMPALFQANSDRATVQFTYRDRRRTLDSYGLLARAGFWYVMGHDRDADEIRTYRVDRIQGGVDAGPPGAYEIPAGFDPAAAFPADAKMVGEGEVVSA